MTLFQQHCGEGKQSLVLLHGWGLNAQVWEGITAQLGSQFRITLFDLPGYGRSQPNAILSLSEMAQQLAANMADDSIVVGWSLGGLVAIQLAHDFPEKVSKLVFIGSSPCFVAQNDWPGIEPSLLNQFQQQLTHNYQRTIERFIALQTLGGPEASANALSLKKAILAQPQASMEVLEQGLQILLHSDLRPAIQRLSQPVLRIYGALDILVPKANMPYADQLWPQGKSVMIDDADHAPFISHPDQVLQLMTEFADLSF